MRGSGLIALVAATACSFTHGAAVGGGDGNRDSPVGDVVDDAPSVVGPCAPLGPAANPIMVSTIAELRAAVATAPTGSNILLADGTYSISPPVLSITTAGLTLRSQSNNATGVVITGTTSPLIRIGASNVTIGAVTIRKAPTIGILVEPQSGGDIIGDMLYDVTFDDDVGPAVRIYPYNASPTLGPYADFGTIACSRFTDTAAVDHCALPSELGIDAVAMRGWTIRNNELDHLSCPTKLIRSIWIRGGSRDTQLISNRVLDSNGNITLGNDPNGPALARSYTDAVPTTCSGLAGKPPQHWGGLVCDNSIAGLGAPMYTANGYFDDGLALWGACETWALHNTVVSPTGTGTNHDIEYRFAGTYVHLVNNLTEAPPSAQAGATLDVTYGSSNVLYTGTTDFVNALSNDLHLSASASEAAGASIDGLGMCQTDGDGKMRTLASPVVGAFER